MYGMRDAKNTEEHKCEPQGPLNQRYSPQGPPRQGLGGSPAAPRLRRHRDCWETDYPSDASACDTLSRRHRPGRGWTKAGGLCGEDSAKQGVFSEGPLHSAEG